MIRPATADDVPWMAGLALRRYGARIKSAEAVHSWLAAVLSNPEAIVLRCESAFVVAALQRFFYDPQPEARLVYLVSEGRSPWRPLALLRAVLAWAKALGCRDLVARDGTDYVLEPLMRRLGTTQRSAFYRVAIP